jgi:meiosis-specific transcription factor NDT80
MWMAIGHPGQHISARAQYSQAIPSFRRSVEHSSRSPTFPSASLRRNPLSPTSNQVPSFPPSAARMDPQFPTRPAQTTNLPPLDPTQTLGTLTYADGSMTPVNVEISASIDKGFFLADNEWTCYRRNYFACLCSYTLTPHYPNSMLQFTPSNSTQTVQVCSLLMSISAVVADNDQHSIDLVQHTPKRDKGPTTKPEKVALQPKQHIGHHTLNVFSDGSTVGHGRGIFGDTLGSVQANGQSPQTEHTFERIQFKQATQNNGKRRAAQQYYRLVIELWADTGSQRSEHHVKVAIRRSAKMIVRGRSPGHYQPDRRSSHSSGPGGSAGTMGYGTGMGNHMGDFSTNSMIGGTTHYGGGYDPRGPMYGMRHHDIPNETTMPTEQDKAIQNTKDYVYFPSPIYTPEDQDQVEMYMAQSQAETMPPPLLSSNDVDTRKKLSGDDHAEESRRLFFPLPPTGKQQPCGYFEGRARSSGYYPAISP